MVELRRVELLTSCLQGRRSSQLSYTPMYSLLCKSKCSFIIKYFI